jgi:hypothetical protein
MTAKRSFIGVRELTWLDREQNLIFLQRSANDVGCRRTRTTSLRAPILAACRVRVQLSQTGGRRAEWTVNGAGNLYYDHADSAKGWTRPS